MTVQRRLTASLTRSSVTVADGVAEESPASAALASASIEASVAIRRSAGSDGAPRRRRTAPRRPSRRHPRALELGAELVCASAEAPRSISGHRPLSRRLGGLHRLQVGQEPVDDAGAALVVLEALTDDAAGEVDRQRADLGAQRGDRLLTLGLRPGRAPCSTIRVASACAWSRASEMIWAPCSRASSRILAASWRASASCALYSSSALWASSLASSSSANSSRIAS